MSAKELPRLEPGILENCLDQLPIGAIIVDDEGIIQRFNRHEEQLSGLSREEVLGKTFFSEVAPCTNDIELGARFREGIHEGNLDIDIEFNFPYPYNRVARDVRIRAFSVQGHSEHANLILIEEITSQRELERNNQNMLSSLRAMVGGKKSEPDSPIERARDASSSPTRIDSVCLYADLSSFRSIAEQVDPDELFGILDARIRSAVHAIHRYGGHVDEITGDSILAYFVLDEGEQQDRAFYDAVRAARDLCGADGEDRFEIPFRVGLSRGPLTRGSIGREEFSQKITVGSAFTAARRLSSLASPSEIVLSAEVEDRLGDSIRTSELPRLPIAGLENEWPAHLLERVDLP